MLFQRFFNNSGNPNPSGNTKGWHIVWIVFALIGISNFRQTAIKTTQPDSPLVNPPASERMRRIDDNCSNLTRPEKVFFISRSAVERYDLPAVVYHFKTEREFRELLPVFAIWFADNGWQALDLSGTGFKKGRQRVRIEPDTTPGSNLLIECAELPEPNQ